MKRTLLRACIAAAVIAAVPSVRADAGAANRAWTNCQGGSATWSELRISGCSDAITAGKLEGAELAKAYYFRGNAYLGKSEYRKAIDDYTAALALTPGDANALHERCFARAVLGAELEDALSDCNESLRIRPNDGETLGGRGFVYLRLGFYRTAILDYDAALEHNPGTALFLYARGTAKVKAGDVEAGNADLTAARSADPEIDTIFARYDEAAGTGFWGSMVAYWSGVMKWIY